MYNVKQCYEKSRNLDTPKLLRKKCVNAEIICKSCYVYFVSIYSLFLYVLELKETENKAKNTMKLRETQKRGRSVQCQNSEVHDHPTRFFI